MFDSAVLLVLEAVLQRSVISLDLLLLLLPQVPEASEVWEYLEAMMTTMRFQMVMRMIEIEQKIGMQAGNGGGSPSVNSLFELTSFMK